MVASPDWQLAEQQSLNPPAPSVRPSSPMALVLRVLIAVGLVVGGAQIAARPVQKSVSELMDGLALGQVRTLTIERLPADSPGSGTFQVAWTGSGRPGYASYQLSKDVGQPPVDEGAAILAAAASSPSPVGVELRNDGSRIPGIPDVTPTWLTLSSLVALGLLIAGRQPRLATKWAWFWLAVAMMPFWLAFVVLEPVPMWSDQPQPMVRRRLTGGWAFLLSLLLAGAVASAWPDWKDLLTH